MVRHLFIVFFLLPLSLFSGEFISSVSRNPVSVGEGFILSLTLKDASAKRGPATDQLNNFFYVQSQQQSSNTSIINGKSTSTTTWKLTLIPRAEGETVIPSIKIETSNGVLSSHPIAIQVTKKSAGSEANSSGDMTLSAAVSNLKPYKNEPIAYTVKLSSPKQLANLQIEKLTVEDAIVESNGEPKIYTKAVNGVQVNSVEFNYLITPLKAGPLKIPPIVIQGLEPNERKKRTESFFENDFEFFSMLQGFDRFKRFARATEEILLEIKPPQAGNTPWIPAKSLTVEEAWDDTQQLQVGEPISRGFTIISEGLKSTQLPGLSEHHASNAAFKIYADKPELKDEIKEGNITGYRKEQYTLIPQQAGVLTLPEITVAWWNVAKDEQSVAILPSRTLHIQPAPPKAHTNTAPQPIEENSFQPPIQQTSLSQNTPWLYAAITILTASLAAALGWVLILQRKLNRLSKNIPKKEKYNPFADEKNKTMNKSSKEKLPDLNPT